MRCDNFVKLGKKLKGSKKTDSILGYLPNRLLGTNMTSYERMRYNNSREGRETPKPWGDINVGVLYLDGDWEWLESKHVQNKGYERCGGEINISIGIEYGPHRDDEEINIGVRCERCKDNTFDFLPHGSLGEYPRDWRGISSHLTYDNGDTLAEWASAVIETLTLKQLVEILEKMKAV